MPTKKLPPKDNGTPLPTTIPKAPAKTSKPPNTKPVPVSPSATLKEAQKAIENLEKVLGDLPPRQVIAAMKLGQELFTQARDVINAAMGEVESATTSIVQDFRALVPGRTSMRDPLSPQPPVEAPLINLPSGLRSTSPLSGIPGQITTETSGIQSWDPSFEEPMTELTPDIGRFSPPTNPSQNYTNTIAQSLDGLEGVEGIEAEVKSLRSQLLLVQEPIAHEPAPEV